MYGKINAEKPRVTTAKELDNFTDIIKEEVSEVNDVLAQIENGDSSVAVATSLADWLGDIVVYCTTKSAELGIDLPAVLDVIMQSNFSKLGADGKPIHDDRNKVLKGENYWKPESQIQEIIKKQLETK
jgi:predicted HAD superfamily Cof-like phosphohydrolase